MYYYSTKKLLLAGACGLLAATTFGSAVFNGKDSITVQGKDNTLQTIAADLKNPDVFSYDPETKTAVSKYTIILVKDAVLTLGKKDDKESGENLVMDCGDSPKKNSHKIFIKQDCEFNMYYSKIIGKNSKLPKNKTVYRFSEALIYYYRTKGEIVDSEISSAGYAFRFYPAKGITVKGLKVTNCFMAESRLSNTIEGLKLDKLSYITIGRPSTFVDCDFGNAIIRTKPMVKKDFDINFKNCLFNPKKLRFKKTVPTRLIVDGKVFENKKTDKTKQK
jgi:hypothetical protein